MILKKTAIIIFSFFVFTAAPLFPGTLLDISGDYLFYSYDHNYIFGKGNIYIKAAQFEFFGTYIEINLKTRSLLLSSSCRMVSPGKEPSEADMIRIDLSRMSVVLYRFGEKIDVITAKGSLPNGKFERIGRKKLYESLLYFISRKFRIKTNFELTGYNVTIFIEGAQSVTFKKFRMDKGISRSKDLFSINNLWYTNTSGLITDVSFNFKKGAGKIKFSNFESIKLNYDLFKIKSDTPDPEFNIRSESSLKFSDSGSITLKGGYITGNSGQATLKWNFKPLKNIISSVSLDYRDGVNSDSELWIRTDLGLDFKKAGQLKLRYNHEKNFGYSGDFSYNNSLGKYISFSASSNISGIRISDSILSKISDTRLSLNYTNRIFNFSANYSLNRDLMLDSSRYSPGFNFNTTPLTFYGGLLNFNFTSTLLFNIIRKSGLRENSFRSNSSLSISGKKLNVTKDLFVDLSGKIEQFFDNDPFENFTSAGVVIRGIHNLSADASIELIYNFYTRRETRNWLITGTSTGDLSALLRFNTSDKKFNFWGSVSYDIARGEYTSGFFNLRYNLIKSWSFQSFVNYDFKFNKIYYNIFLERVAGRILLRASYRSLSRQFQVEVIPR